MTYGNMHYEFSTILKEYSDVNIILLYENKSSGFILISKEILFLG